jgi:thioredoxin
MRAVTDETFEPEVLRAGRPVVVDFWAPWCGPCRAIEPALEALAEAHEAVGFVKIDIDANPRVAERYGVLSLPTVILFAGGEPRETVYGARPKKHFEKTFRPYFDRAASQAGAANHPDG